MWKRIWYRNIENCGLKILLMHLNNGCLLILIAPQIWLAYSYSIFFFTSATEPHPCVQEPKSHSGWVEDHLSLCTFFVFFFQQLQTSVQLHYLDKHNDHTTVWCNSGFAVTRCELYYCKQVLTLVYKKQSQQYNPHTKDFTCRRSVEASIKPDSSGFTSRDRSRFDLWK